MARSHGPPQLEPIDTSEIEGLLEQARIKVETLVPLDAHHLLGFVHTEIKVALDALKMRQQFEDHDRFRAGLIRPGKRTR